MPKPQKICFNGRKKRKTSRTKINRKMHNYFPSGKATAYAVYFLQVFCTVTAFSRDVPEPQSLPEESKGFYAGIKVTLMSPIVQCIPQGIFIHYVTCSEKQDAEIQALIITTSAASMFTLRKCPNKLRGFQSDCKMPYSTHQHHQDGVDTNVH